MKFLVTGATGFIGRALVQELIRKKFNVSIAIRQRTNLFNDQVKQFIFDDFSKNPDLSSCLKDIDCLIHLASKVHEVGRDNVSDLDSYKKINTDFTLNLGKQAISAGVKKFIFLSSIGVNGYQSEKPFLESDIPNPQGPYAISKYEAELGLLDLASNNNLEVVIIRPPLVYGDNAPGNFGRLTKWARAKFSIPLPLGAVNNLRSFIALENLLSFIITCSRHPNAANQVFLVSDDEDFSTTQLLKKVAKAFNKKPWLLPIPVSYMIFLAKLLGKEADAERLFSSLTIDNSRAKHLLGWRPVTSMNKQLRKVR
jgi:nucleoside-diphosphate-sugar epimerase